VPKIKNSILVLVVHIFLFLGISLIVVNKKDILI
jgi:hypothetical protein